MEVVLIPAYEPDTELISITKKLKEEGFSVLVVDDGSGEKYKDIFAKAEENATVIELWRNSGKGAALKFGMKYIKDNMPDCKLFITCDADGQHKVEDCIRVREKLRNGEKFVLTTRKKRKGIPLRSKIGNNLSRFVYAILANRYLSDNQSGLRGFSREYLSWLMDIKKDNYDYEMNVLYYAAKRGVKICTLEIEAIYIGNNESSHFNPIKDTVRIYKSLFSSAITRVISFLLSEIAILLITIFSNYNYMSFFIAGVGALNCATNILLDSFVFFRKPGYYDYWNTTVYTIIHYVFYTLLCSIWYFTMPQVPLFISFNINYLLCIPLRYLLHKAIYIASQTRE